MSDLREEIPEQENLQESVSEETVLEEAVSEETISDETVLGEASAEEGGEQAPDLDTLTSELEREQYRKRFRGMLQSTVFVLIVVAAAAILVATIWMPVLQVYGTSMTPGLNAGDIVVCRKTENFSRGDVLAFYYNNKIQIKRIIAVAGDEVVIEDDGTVHVNEMILREPYVTNPALGENTDIKMPFLVPDGKVFVMGDNREEAIDSRSSGLGCVDPEQYIGKLEVCVWPFGSFGLVR